jgi:hypothetical protein
MKISHLVERAKNVKYTMWIFCALLVLSYLGQNITLPLAEASFGDHFGIYFVVWFESLLFNIVFWPAVAFQFFYSKTLTKSMLHYCKKDHLLFIGTGFFDAINGILICSCVSLSRVSGPLQNILMQTSFFFGVSATWFFLRRKRVSIPWMLLTGALVATGIIIGLVPSFVSGQFSSSSWIWPVLLVVAQIPGAAMNTCMNAISDRWKKYLPILNKVCDEERPLLPEASPKTAIQNEVPSFSYPLILAFESLYQFIFVSLCFWSDFVPGFGTSANINEWATTLWFDISCFFWPGYGGDKSYYTTLLCCAFALAYCASYYWTQAIMDRKSNILVVFAATIAGPIAIIFWLIFPSLDVWAGGTPPTTMDIIFSLACLPFMCAGTFLYGWKGEKDVSKSVQVLGEIN